MCRSDIADGLVVGRLAIEIDRDHATGLEPALSWLRRSRLRDSSTSRLKLSGRTSTNTGVAPDSTATSTVATKVKAGTNTASPGPIPSAIKRQQQRIGAIGAADAMPRAAERRQLTFELGDLRPQHKLAVVQHRGDGPLDAVAKPLALRGEINEGRNGLLTLCAHAISTEALGRILAVQAAKSA